MQKLGTWAGGAIAALLLLVGLAGLTQAQDRDVAWLGVVTQSIDEGLRDGMDFRGEGVLVTRVVNDGPADRAGVERGDILVNLDGRAIGSPERLTRMIQSSRVGESKELVISRDGRRRTIRVRLGQRPDDLSRLERERWERRPGDLDLETLPRQRPGERDFVMRGMGRGRLGVRVEDVNEDNARDFDSEETSGALIVEVLDDTPASRAGLRSGDVITRVGGRRISDSGDLVEALRQRPEGRVSITLRRNGQDRTVEAELEPATRMFRWDSRDGRDLRVLRPRERTATPRAPQGRELRSQESDEKDMEEELQRLRDEVRELRRQLDEKQGDDRDDDDDDEDDDNSNDDDDDR